MHEPATVGAFLAATRWRDVRHVWDVGALYGYFVLLAEHLYPKAEITAFEMHPTIIQGLIENVSPKTGCVHAAISDEIKLDVMHWVSGFNIFEKPSGGWGELPKIPGAFKQRGENNRGRGFSHVDFITLDAWAETHPAPDLIKIDVEGYQAKAILGARKLLENANPIIVIELHDPEKLARFGISNAQTVQPLYDLGYRGFWCGNHRAIDAAFEEVTQMEERHEKLSIMVFSR